MKEEFIEKRIKIPFIKLYWLFNTEAILLEEKCLYSLTHS